MKLYGYWRSSSSYRLRLALAFKRVPAQMVPVHLVRGGGEQFAHEYRALNPAARVPTLVLDNGRALSQSLAIIEWLEETVPDPALLPSDPVARAQCRALALEVAADAQPLHNSGVLTALRDRYGVEKDQWGDWVLHWVRRACDVLAARADERGPFLMGEAPTLADICLVPHLYTGERWGMARSEYPRLFTAHDALLAWPGMADAHPDAQDDAE